MREQRPSPRAGPSEGPPERGISLSQLQLSIGAPTLVASLTQGYPTKLPPTQCWVLLPSESMIQTKLVAGQQLLVGITTQSVPGSSSSGPRPSTSFAPTNLPSLDPRSCQVHSLWDLVPAACSPSLAATPGVKPPVGDYVMAATAWPMPKMPRGSVALSPSLMEMCGGVAAGRLLVLFATNGQDLKRLGSAEPCQRLSLRLCTQQLTMKPVTLPRNKGQATEATTTGSTSIKQGPSAAASRQLPVASSSHHSEWLLTLMHTSQSSSQLALLQRIVIKHLEGRTLLPGNPLSAPILGHTLLFRCEAALTPSSVPSPLNDAARDLVPPSTAPPSSSGSLLQAPLHAPATVSLDTALELLLLPGDQASFGRPPSALDLDARGQAVQWEEEQYKAELIATARAAAEEAVSGSAAEAAAAAAERAVVSGLSSASGGFDELGGVSETAASLRELVSLPLRSPHLFTAFRIRPPRGVLLWGPPGSGKTVLARAAAADAGAVLLVINGPDVVSEFYGESEAGLRGIFAAARVLSPCVILIDEVDAIAGARQEHGAGGMAGALASAGAGAGGGMSSRMLTVLLTLMDGFTTNPDADGVVVIAATNRPEAIDSALRRPGRFERELEIGVPSPQARLDILNTRLKGINHCLPAEAVSSLASSAHGFVGADLSLLVDEAALSALRRVIASRARGEEEELCVLPEDFQSAETRVRPSAMRQVAVEVPRVQWSDIGGLNEVKQRLQEVVEWPSRHPEALMRLGATAPKGILLYGPPGCSKTLLARAVACEAGLNFLSIKGGELFSKFVGESEKAIASLFSRARATAPSVVFFDEIDALASSRSSEGESGVGVNDRVLSQLLMEMDGLQARAGVVVMAATNRPDCVDAALLRPGRFDRLVFVPPPDQEARLDIFKVHLRRTPLAADVDVAELAALTPGYTGADISALCREAALAALAEDLQASEVAFPHFKVALDLVPPSAAASQDLLMLYQRFNGSPGLQVA